VTLLFDPPPPILAPTTAGEAFPVRRIFCIGRNYAAHAREMGRDPDREPPFFFTAWAETLAHDGDTIAYPQGTSDYQYEGEMVIAIGKPGRNIDAAQALAHVYGYACGLDMTRRDLQMVARGLGRPWDTAKNVEQSSPLGLIQPAGAGFDPGKGSIRLTVNGEVKQQGDLADMIWPVADINDYISSLYKLQAGDLIYSGTPAGVGPVVTGDQIRVEIEGLPALLVTLGPPAAD
jgi:fumarylpyruvate hydrolase